MDTQTLHSTPHRRFNRLTGEWVLVSPHRTARPWQGQVEALSPVERPAYDPQCYLCPGNKRAGETVNPAYDGTFVFQNDYSALLPDAAPTPAVADDANRSPMLVAEVERGVCRVICFSPRHDLTLAGMELLDIRRVVDTWAAQYEELGAIDWVSHVQIFENRGAVMGASNPHPHGQIWANERLPNEPAKELVQQRAYMAAHGRSLLADYLTLELEREERIVCANAHWVALVPFWAVWPFETMLLPRGHYGAISDLPPEGRDSLAAILQKVTRAYDRLFQVAFPYTMGFHQRPTDGAVYPEWLLHAHFYPPLLRSATVRKFMVGYELLGQPQRDITPEVSAARLRDLI